MGLSALPLVVALNLRFGMSAAEPKKMQSGALCYNLITRRKGKAKTRVFSARGDRP